MGARIKNPTRLIIQENGKFEKKGGLTEKLYKKRTEYRNSH